MIIRGDLWTPTQSGNAVAADIANGKIAFSDGVKVTGNRGVDQYTSSLLHFAGSNNSQTFTDETGKTWTVAGNAIISTVKYAIVGSCAYFDGNGDYISTPNHESFNFGNGDFTIDFRYLSSGTYDRHSLYTQYDDANNFIQISAVNSNLFFAAAVGGSNVAQYTWTSVVSASSWSHYAIIRKGTSMELYVNGNYMTPSVTANINTSSMPNLSGPVIIGATKYTGYESRYLYGYIAEFRVSKGIARWTVPFVPGSPYGG